MEQNKDQSGAVACSHNEAVTQYTGDGKPVSFCPDCGRNEPMGGAAVRGEAAADINFLCSTMDAQVWATEFCKLNNASDHGMMLGWFANAIMAGFDEANRRSARAADAPSEPSETDLLEVARTLCSIAARRQGLTAVQRPHYPHVDEEGSPVLDAARAACVKRGYTEDGLSIEGGVYPVAADALDSQPSTDEPTDREALIACLGDDAATLSRANPDDEMAQTMREAAAMLENDGKALESQPTVSAVLSELRADLRELANNTDTFGEHSQEAARVAFDSATDALDEVAAQYASSQPTDGGVRNG